MQRPTVYMDNHATTRVDPRVVTAMLPFFSEHFGNAGSIGHSFGEEAKQATDRARESIARCIGAQPREIVFTSGATESNNLALKGVAQWSGRKGRHIVSVATEHPSVLDPLDRLSRRGFEITLLPVRPAGSAEAGLLDLAQLERSLRADTILVSVMLANNEIGAIQPLAEIGALCRSREVLVHCDATQAVGKMDIDVASLPVDLVSFSAHKIYGPKGVGALYVRRGRSGARLECQIDGGGQEGGLRSGTLNVPGIVGFARALELCHEELLSERPRLAALRSRLFEGLTNALDGVTINGPGLDDLSKRLPGNLNLSFAGVDGEALMMSMSQLAVSSGSACTSADPTPSHVVRALGIGDDLARASLRFGLGRFNTPDDIEFAIETVVGAVRRLRELGAHS